MNIDLLHKYSGAVPRYTSYPTAPHFHEGIDNTTYRGWLGALGHRNRLSLYVHIPYCDRLCWFCACHTKHTLKYEPIAIYLEALKQEIAAVGALVSPDAVVSAVHFGGGSPTMLDPQDMQDLMDCLRRHFTFGLAPEISVEMDPNDLDDSRYDALAAIGMSRASLGVQDFDDKVQKTINRIQSFEQTRSVVDAVRARGVHSVNCDILYGLPFQTCETLKRTVDQIVSLAPDRIALFGYAHVPWMKKHQSLIPEHALPDVAERYRQMTMAGEMLRQAGYSQIGIDHFARPTDTLSQAAEAGALRRNFQGYTTDTADALIGLGASSIGRLPQGYVQNMVATGEYQRMVGEGGLAAVKGIELSQDDHLRSHVIERLMCDFSIDLSDLQHRFGKVSHSVRDQAQQFAAGDRDGLVRLDADIFAVTEVGRPFVRNIAAIFDTYLGNGRGRHSVAV
ncbi:MULTISPECIES: oxygen-independent coproporphyrinogen III oxidase [Agrobacterium]|jgi:oxygen-independent coproporphyrinogen-3 oxidase|uniref:oxygen-independent coproporphyrinogen III oxidase n=1 Tax=Agrobacterium TaxID=357 RepID=UPI00027D64A6|nr:MULTISPECIES: oxygen-independent coproporphyrinogen III oxidase [Agrobacterium]AUC09766.1 oxygen-independent coproporphyrinogen III oxidase [Rhizobium sp. Y9]KIV61351.1 Coproporphyrinogen III oxidase, oxygen-independent [Rhizobium sp. UR51a]MDP9776325.1 oxygen-independent coproporphyrinogen-3 oxidase [Rhizobium sp. SORGH_AS_0755]OAI81994.1 coproporphyrinogen III oxidase [Rhizobium sp. GHKF11]PZU73902.1 MAG: oxygen-independent coproporphyrinogen III oxidase [Rhizobium sp.]